MSHKHTYAGESTRKLTEEGQPLLVLCSETDHSDTHATMFLSTSEAAEEHNDLWKRLQSKAKLEARLRKIAKELSEPSPLLPPPSPSLPSQSQSLVLSPDSSFTRTWQVLSTFLLTFTFIVLPFNFAFHANENDSMWLYLNALTDFLFAIDLVLRLNTGYYDQSYRLVTSRTMILRKYGYFWVFVDFIATVPLHFMTTKLFYGRFYRINRLFRLIKLLKLFKIFQSSRNSFDLVDKFSMKLSSFRFLSFLAATILASHIFACLWCFLPVMEVNNPKNWMLIRGVMEESDVSKYLTALEFTIQTLASCGYGDLPPTTCLEQVICMLWMSFAVLFVSYTVGSLGAVLDPQNSKENTLIRKQAVIDEMAHEAGISPELRLQLRQAVYQGVENSDSLQKEILSVFEDLPVDLRYEIAQVIHHSALQFIPFFHTKSQSFISDIFPLLKPRSIPKSLFVYDIKHTPEHIFFISMGRCGVISKEKHVIKILKPGNYFGDIEIITGKARLHAVRTITDCEFLTINRLLLRKIIKKYPLIYEEMKSMAEKKEQDWNQTAGKMEDLRKQYCIQLKEQTMKERLADVKERRRSSVASIDVKQLQVHLLSESVSSAAQDLETMQEMFKEIGRYVGVEEDTAPALISPAASEFDIYSGYETPTSQSPV